MSGIAGYINNVEKAPNALLDSMSESIQFTENDCIDKWSDDFLAISRVHHGVINSELQPIYNEDKSLLIVMDGEVFDYEEQKLKLIHNGHKFKFKNNDAEYCLHLYEEMQEKAFKELNGSFCFTIYNLITHELLLVNDRFSSCSLFYYLTEAKLSPKIATIPNSNTGVSPLIPEFLEWGLILIRKVINKVYSLKFYQVPHPTYTQGAWSNFAELVRHNEKIKKLISNTLGDSECLNPKIFNIQGIKEMFKEHLSSKTDYTEFLFLLLTFGRWHKKYGPKNTRSV